jgi:Homeodomain-like domain
VEQGLEAALNRRAPRREYRCKLDGEQEAQVVALACSSPPRGRDRWSLRLLADKLVELQVVERISYQTVRRALKKNFLKPWLRKQWVIPPAAAGELVGGLAGGLQLLEQGELRRG